MHFYLIYRFINVYSPLRLERFYVFIMLQIQQSTPILEILNSHKLPIASNFQNVLVLIGIYL